jgi:hypothetical protein
MFDWPKPLVRDVARRKSIIVIGAGVSRHSTGKNGERAPLWREFLQQAIDDCPNQKNLQPVRAALESGDYLHCCEWLKKRYDYQWQEYLQEKFAEPAYSPALIHEKIFLLDSRVVFSLNFDDIFERYAQNTAAGSYLVKHYYDEDVSDFLRGDRRYIIKVHGGLNAPKKTIFTHSDYSRARVESASFYSAFESALLSYTFLFIGCGYADPDINLMLENHNFTYSQNNPHYFLTDSEVGEDRVESLRQNRNLEVLKYDNPNEDHAGLIDMLSSLVEKVDEKREDLRTTLNW